MGWEGEVWGGRGVWGGGVGRGRIEANKQEQFKTNYYIFI